MKKFDCMDKKKLLQHSSPEIQELFESLNQLNDDLSRAFRDRFDRNLPFTEMLFDRWEKSKNLGFGEGTSAYDNALIFGNVTVGKNTWVGPYTILDGSGGLKIGDYCSISAGVQIYSHNTVQWALSGGAVKYQHKTTEIGSCCFVGPMVIIQNGITIGDHCLIGANSFVNKDLPPFSIAAGSPATCIGKVKIVEKGKVELEYFDRVK